MPQLTSWNNINYSPSNGNVGLAGRFIASAASPEEEYKGLFDAQKAYSADLQRQNGLALKEAYGDVQAAKQERAATKLGNFMEMMGIGANPTFEVPKATTVASAPKTITPYEDNGGDIILTHWDNGKPYKVPSQYLPALRQAAAETGLPVDYLAGIALIESNFNPNEYSHKKAAGIMQLMPETAKDVGLTEAERWIPEKNILGAAKYIKKFGFDKYGGDYLKAAAAYNAGPWNKYMHSQGAMYPPYKETMEYIRRLHTVTGGRYFDLPPELMKK